MADTRRMGPAKSETRTLLLDHAERLMAEEGYAAVTSRRLAKDAGLSPQIVYYYFQTMDALFEAVFVRLAETLLKASETVKDAEDPLMALWNLSADPATAVLTTEIVALANHRKGLRALVQKFGREYQSRQAEIIGAEYARLGYDLALWPPMVLAAVMENMARGFALGESLQVTAQDEARDFVRKRLREFSAGLTAGTAPPSHR